MYIFVYLIVVIKLSMCRGQGNAFTQTEIACKSEHLKIECESDEFIKIVSANYGRTSANVCKSTSNKWDGNDCISPSTFNIVSGKCDGNRMCFIPSNNIFDDMCPRTEKYIDVEYVCVPKKKEVDKHNAFACQNKEIIMECAQNKVIMIISSNYGRKSALKCAEHTSDPDELADCSSSSYPILSKRCDGLNICYVAALNSVFEDNCPNVKKYLEVEYICIEAPPPLGCEDTDLRISTFSNTKHEASACNIKQELPKIIKVIGCESNTLNIECPIGKYIQILRANYGRTSQSTCYSAHTNIWNDACISPMSIWIVSAQCDSKRACSFEATNDIFGDPCGGTSKYLEVHYKCLAHAKQSCTCEEVNVINKAPDNSKACSKEDVPETLKAFACEVDLKPLNIECKVGEYIQIIRANYGRTSESVCLTLHENKWDVACVSPASFWIVDTACDSQTLCSIEPSNHIFGDPCSYTEKYLEVHYKCLTYSNIKCTCDKVISDTCAFDNVVKLNKPKLNS